MKVTSLFLFEYALRASIDQLVKLIDQSILNSKMTENFSPINSN